MPGLAPGPGAGAGAADCNLLDLGGCVSNSINAFIGSVVTEGLNALLRVLSDSLLSTPDPRDLPALVELWTGSWQLVLLAYGLLVMAAGIVIMGYETVQTRYSIREIAPRIVFGFLAGALSMIIASTAISLVNAATAAILNSGVAADQGADRAAALGQMITSALASGDGVIFIPLIGLAICVALVVLLLTYIVRVAFTIILIAGAPVVLMFHALPHTDGMARWWWRSFGACLAIQLLQSLTLVTALRVLLTPGNPLETFGDKLSRSLVTLLVVLALFFILIKIPFWLMSTSKISSGPSLVSSLARGYLSYKSLGLINARGAAPGRSTRRSTHSHVGRRPGGGAGGTRVGSGRGPRPGPTDPYSHVQQTRDGQLLLPLSGLTRRRRPNPTPPATTPHASTAHPRQQEARLSRGRQLSLPLSDGDWPENRPILGSGGQYRLPFTLARSAPPSSTPPSTRRASASPPRHRPPGQRSQPRRHPAGRQLELPLDPFRGNRPLRSGQYPLPLEGLPSRPRRQSSAPAAQPPANRPTPRSRPTTQGRQLPLPLEHPDLPMRPRGPVGPPIASRVAPRSPPSPSARRPHGDPR
ncbi:hypothetical protein [Pseudonocardia sp. TRM90224]|uniref:hypothetical protein n=1 Tax=Pseudonocardia sp. TRM90224 TaxID=2812678 RepID=UPI001E330E95|nr:hypothetical protein [Pseudonocardia sp. TRM90224]